MTYTQDTRLLLVKVCYGKQLGFIPAKVPTVFPSLDTDKLWFAKKSKPQVSPFGTNENKPFVRDRHTAHCQSSHTSGFTLARLPLQTGSSGAQILHTDLRLISSRSRVLERHVRVSLFCLFYSANRISLFQSPKVSPPRAALISATVGRP